MRFPVLSKAAAVGLVLLVILWALDLVSGIVAERSERLHEAQRSVADSLASSQTIVGPVLQRVCSEKWEVEKGEGKERRRVVEERTFALRALPSVLRVDGDSKTDPRYRGIFKVNGFVLSAKLVADWADTSALLPKRLHEGSRLDCGPTFVWAGVSDSRGIRRARIVLANRDVAVTPGSNAPAAGHTFQALWPATEEFAGGPAQATIELELAGTEDLAFAPIASSTRVTLKSDWPHPSFSGRFLPVTREVTPAGFTASWQVDALATQAPLQVQSTGTLCRPASTRSPPAANCIESFGVGFIEPVNPYTLSDRATKYGLLFIALTFVAVGLVEVLRRLRVHPIQYLLVGAALTTFFLLLVSLSEHFSFGIAYLAASAACTALLSFYGSFVLGGAKPGMAFGTAIGLLFGILYVLLLQEQTALVIGSVLIFAVVAAVMIVTRRINWYSVINQLRSSSRVNSST